MLFERKNASAFRRIDYLCVPKTLSEFDDVMESPKLGRMIGLLCFVLASPFKSKLRLQAENVVLRHQLNVLKRMHGRVRLMNHDRWFFIQLYRWFPAILKVLTIIPPETLVRWHRAGFRCYWRWKSRPRPARQVTADTTRQIPDDRCW
jgi:hypothetical protein